MILPCRWLIDNDKEMEGLQVIADLHGGDTDDPIAMAVYQEIKDKVREDVCISHFEKYSFKYFISSARIWRRKIISTNVEEVQTTCSSCNVVTSFRSVGK